MAVEAVLLPGRDGNGNANGGPSQLTAKHVAADIARRLSTPYALYGHSMGARLAFEVVRELRRSGAPLPATLYVGGAHPPDVAEPLARLAVLSDDDFVEQLIARAGAPEELRDDPELRALVLPALRTDFEWIKHYRYRPEPPLPMPIVAFAGTDDRVLPPMSMLGWQRQSAEGLRLHTLPGNHLFLQSEPDLLTHLIAADLQGESIGWPADDEVHVWLAQLDQLPSTCGALDELSRRERERAAAFRHERDRRHFVGRSVVLRRLLRKYGTDVGTEELPTARRGKPYVDTEIDLRFSMSHSDGLALLAFTRGQEVGVDIERVRPMADFDAFCDGALDPHERAELTAASEDTRLPLALRIWTAKEAVLKATGDGLGVEPNDFGFSGFLPGEPWRARVQPALERLAAWRVTHLPLEGAIGAVAVERDRWRLRYETVTEALR